MKAKHLPTDELDAIIAHLTVSRADPWALACEVLVRSGARTHELCQLTANSVDAKRGTLFITGAKGSNDRAVPVDADCLLAFEQALLFKIMPWQEARLDTVKRNLRKYWAKLRIALLGPSFGNCSLHGLRASFAVRVYLDVGHDVLLIRELLGHRSIDSTMQYVRLTQAESKAPEILQAFKRKRARPY